MTDDYTMSVLSYEKRDRSCPACGSKRILFVCHGVALPWRDKIREYCKGCATYEAGGHARIWVKTTFPKLRQVWAKDARPDKPAHLPAGRSLQNDQKVPQRSNSGVLTATDEQTVVRSE